MAERQEVDEELFGDDIDLGQDQDQIDEGGDAQDDEETTQISFGDEEEDKSSGDSNLVKHLRNQLRERDKELAERRKAEKPIEVGPKPTLAEHDYDEEAYDEALQAWHTRVSEAEAQKQQGQSQANVFQADFDDAKTRFATTKAALRVSDFDEADETVGAALSVEQMAVLVMAAKNSAAVVYALGKHPNRLTELAAVKNPIKLAAAVANLEKDLKVSTTRRAPPPEGNVRGSARISAGTDKTEERLAREAERTGDRTKLIAYRKSKRQGER